MYAQEKPQVYIFAVKNLRLKRSWEQPPVTQHDPPKSLASASLSAESSPI